MNIVVKSTKQKRVKREYFCRLRKVWNSELNAKTKESATNSWAMGVLRYFLGTIRWSRSEVALMDVKSRKILRQCKARSAKQRPYLPRTEGGRGLQSVELTWEAEVVATARYLTQNQDPQV